MERRGRLAMLLVSGAAYLVACGIWSLPPGSVFTVVHPWVGAFVGLTWGSIMLAIPSAEPPICGECLTLERKLTALEKDRNELRRALTELTP